MQRKYIIHGRVQGVFFRDATRRKAYSLGVHGWIRNCPDGTVEAVAQGEPEVLQQLEGWFRAGGPPDARVDRVDCFDLPEESFQGFSVR